MKKLLLVLSSISIFVTTPLAVVACAPKKNYENLGYDYYERRSQMVSDINNIVSTNLNEQLYPYYFLSKNNSNINNFKFINFNEIVEKLKGSTSNLQIPNSDEYFSGFEKELSSIVNWNSIRSQVGKSVLQNINYRQLIKNNSNPLQKYSLRRLSLSTEGSNQIAKINFELIIPILILDKNGEDLYLNIEYRSAIHIFTNEEELNGVIKFNNSVRSQVINKEVANNFLFNSSSGDLDRNIRNFKNSFANTSVVNFINNVIRDNKNNLSDLHIKNNEFLMNSNVNQVITAAPEFTRVSNIWYSNLQNEDSSLIRPALINGGESLRKLTNRTLDFSDSSNSIIGPRRLVSQEIANQLTPKDFWGFNHIYLKENISTGVNTLFSQILNDSRSEFEISKDSQKDGNVLAVYPVEITNLSVTYESISKDKIDLILPTFRIFVKQFHKYETGNQLIQEWLETNIEMFRELFGFVDKTNNGVDGLSLRFSKEIENNFRFDTLYNTADLMQDAYQEATKRLTKRMVNLNPQLISGLAIRPVYDFRAIVKVSSANKNFYFMNSRGSSVLYYQNISPTFSFFSRQRFNDSFLRGFYNISISLGGQRTPFEPDFGVVSNNIVVANFI
ncbi:hypothetical protein [Spiroplasma alleghenense]|uniref:Lipoprotein n=1 Tax=Spiroplasma alleghenense TaxID=216931 RepID=A0A345Z558_9MOLU|nr:hypothetical protein [Spiroplasma alleghenense]AXK51737.1 hypothetical protein SALLE_v1c10670 [Spiroplasma alleghenense]